DPFPSQAVAQGAEVTDRRDLRERIHCEEDALPKRIERAHRVLHHGDAGEGGRAHHERGEVEEGEAREVMRAELERLRKEAVEGSDAALHSLSAARPVELFEDGPVARRT